MDYGFVHDGKVYTPNQTPDVAASENDERNKAIERAELERWTEKPDRQLAYYHFPKHDTDGRRYRESFFPQLSGETSNGNGETVDRAIVTTWLGTKIGTIISAQVYRHNFGGRFVSLRVRGTNGVEYHGRASYDWGSCVWLRKCKH